MVIISGVPIFRIFTVVELFHLKVYLSALIAFRMFAVHVLYFKNRDTLYRHVNNMHYKFLSVNCLGGRLSFSHNLSMGME